MLLRYRMGASLKLFSSCTLSPLEFNLDLITDPAKLQGRRPATSFQ